MPVATPPPVAHVAVASRLDRAIVRRINAIRRSAGEHPVVLSRRLRDPMLLTEHYADFEPNVAERQETAHYHLFRYVFEMQADFGGTVNAQPREMNLNTGLPSCCSNCRVH